MKHEIKKTEIDGETIYLKKSALGWGVIKPIKNEDGTFNWKNLWLGSRKVIILTIIWILIMGFILYGVNEMVSSCRDMAKNPCNYFKVNCQSSHSNVITYGGDNNEP